MPKTRLTKTGQPVMGTPIDVRLSDGTYETCTVVGKGFGLDGHTLVMVIVEWCDGTRQNLGHFADLEWRHSASAPSDPASDVTRAAPSGKDAVAPSSAPSREGAQS